MEVVNPGYVLFDIPGGEPPRDADFLEELGHRVMVCGGPAPKELCPILSGGECPLAEGAHGVVFELDLDRPQHRAILNRYKEQLRGDVPIRVVLQPGQEVSYANLVHGLKVWTHEPVAGDLDAFVAEVEAAEA